jgi:hypothetical protein
MIFPPMSHVCGFLQYMTCLFGAFFDAHWDQWLEIPSDGS